MAIPLFADRVKETSTTTGTGTLDLDGAATGFLTFVQGIGDGNQCYYVISDGTQFEIGIGTVTAAATDTLSRDTVLQTSNNDTAKISWGAGTRDVYVTLPAAQIISQERLKPYSGRNAVINGDFRIAQRGTGNFSTNDYTMDRWLLSPGGGSTVVDVDRQSFAIGQTAVAGEPQYYVRIDRTNSDSNDTLLSQRIEGVRTFAGQQVTVSYYAKADSSITVGDLAVRAVQDFGSGGSPSSNVTTNFSNPAVTTAWQRFTSTVTVPSISGKTIGTNGDDALTLQFAMIGPGIGMNALELADIQLEIGDIASDFERRPLQQELALCQRYYAKTFSQATAPAQNAGRLGALSTAGVTGGRFIFDWRFPVTMRAAPTITTYNPQAANADARNLTDSTDTAVTADNISDTSVLIRATGVDSTDAGDTIEIHATADAEL